MGVDYDGVGGVGVELTEEMRLAAISNGIFTEEEWEETEHECLEAIGILFSEAGNAYSGDTTWYLFVEGKTLGEVNKNAPNFVAKIKEKFGVSIAVDDLDIIEDGYIW